MERIDCRKCQYFKITWEPNLPYACQFFGFKGKFMPSQMVLSSSGSPCGEFKAIERSRDKNGERRRRF